MKIQIYAAFAAIVWLIAVWKACEEAVRGHSSDLHSVATWTILFGVVLIPLAGRVWGWW